MDVQCVTLILSTTYVVLSLFATRFAARAGGIWVSFMKLYLIQIDIKWSVWEI